MRVPRELKKSPLFASVVSTGDLTIESGASVTIKDALTVSAGLASKGNTYIEGDNTSVSVTMERSANAIGRGVIIIILVNSAEYTLTAERSM